MMSMDGATMKREASKAAGMPYRQDPRTISSPEQPGGGFPIRTDSGLDPTGRPAGRVSRSNRGPAGLGATIRRFRFGERGGATIESAVSLLILVVGFASLMEIVQACYTDDWMSRAARAAARELALNPVADDASAKTVACTAIRRELRLAEDFDCNTAAWTLTVDRGVSPSTLPATLDASVTTGTGDMVLVRIGWNRESLSFDGFVRDANAEDSTEDDESGTGTVSETAIGLARCEIELCGQETS